MKIAVVPVYIMMFFICNTQATALINVTQGRHQHRRICLTYVHCTCYWSTPDLWWNKQQLLTLRCNRFDEKDATQQSLPSSIEAFVARNCGLRSCTTFLQTQRTYSSSLLYLDLSHNQLNEIAKTSPFKMHQRLNVLILNSARIGTLLNGMFDGLIELRVLLLRNNSISQIERGVFADLSQLGQLDLSQNPLGGLYRMWFNELFKLKLTRLQLHACNISIIQADALMSAQNLERLDLSANQLSMLHPNVFRGAENLRYLNLSNNPFQVIPSTSFQLFRRLNHLILDGLAIMELREYAFFSLNVMHLSLNQLPQLRVVHALAFSLMPMLQSLHLSNNVQLRFLHPLAFDQLPKLTELHLHHNQLRFLALQKFFNAQVANQTQLHVSLYNNPLWCDCNNRWILMNIRMSLSDEKTSLSSLRVVNFKNQSKQYCEIEEAHQALQHQKSHQAIKLYFHSLAATTLSKMCAPNVIRVQSSNIITQSKSPLHLSCMTSGIPLPDLVWQLPNHHNVKEPYTWSNNLLAQHGVLSIHSLNVKDSGIYRCHISNSKGNKMLAYHVTVHDPQLKVILLTAGSDYLRVTWTGKERYNAIFYRLGHRLISKRGPSQSDLAEAADAELFQSGVPLMMTMRSYTFYNLQAASTYEVCLLHIQGAPRLDNGRHCALLKTQNYDPQYLGVKTIIAHSTVYMIIGLTSCLIPILWILVFYYKQIYKRRKFYKAGYIQARQRCNSSTEINEIQKNYYSRSCDTTKLLCLPMLQIDRSKNDPSSEDLIQESELNNMNEVFNSQTSLIGQAV